MAARKIRMLQWALPSIAFIILVVNALLLHRDISKIGVMEEIDDINSNNNMRKEYMRNRAKNFYSWYEGNKTETLLVNADKNGTIMDFAIVGFAKCGTTTMEANLAHIAPMPEEQDVCTPIHPTVYYAYKNWPQQYSAPDKEKLFRGTKCPAFIQGGWLAEWSKHLPRTKLIVGIRHPVLWFQSFWNQQRANGNTRRFAGDDPYNVMRVCNPPNRKDCRQGCPTNQVLCMHRGRFHLALAALGKTELTAEERNILAAEDPDGGEDLINKNVINDVFLYEQQTLGEDYVWDELAKYLGAEQIPHDRRHNARGRRQDKAVDFCDSKYDEFRAKMMQISYEVATWLQNYFIPLSKDESRTDVVIPRPDTFYELVESYKLDPCEKLRRLDNGTYILG
mmetsp:Transcript_6375/g.8508  ORF Transcript_6375/g.8508 Transcript_6375/m.8508 type:complete len:393 (+) Transcript_6375:151-1329(+)